MHIAERWMRPSCVFDLVSPQTPPLPQVQQLIEQARDPANLCRMYEGWAPWL